nr:replication protein A 70 kDa DNA-binding subunit B-like [Ipomoea batatas]
MRFKTCEHKYILKANNETVISFSDQDYSIFPKKMFQFKDFGPLKAPGGVVCNQLIDLIGRVVSIHVPKDIQVKQNFQRLIDFVNEDYPLIVILQLCRARVTDDGEVRISSSYTGTKVLFNYECPELFAFKDSLPGFFTPIRSISSRSRNTGSGSLETMSNKNITETSLKDIHDDKKIGEFWIAGEISDIERDWYFTTCRNKGCGKKLQENKDKMYCKSCDNESSDGIIMYKLVIDILDDEQDGQLLHWDNEGCMPNEIDGLIRKTMKLRIVTRKDQFNYRGNAAFTVLGVQTDEAICNSFKKGEQGIVGIEPLEVIPSSNPEVIILDESTPEQQSLKRINMDCSSSSKTLKSLRVNPTHTSLCYFVSV